MITARIVLLTIAAGASLAATAPAFADHWDDDDGYGHLRAAEARMSQAQTQLQRIIEAAPLAITLRDARWD